MDGRDRASRRSRTQRQRGKHARPAQSKIGTRVAQRPGRPGEKAAETALREVFEETGVTAELVAKLADIKYIYSRTWSDGQRVFKIVSFYLMRYRSGRINQIAPEMRIEVARACWIPLEEAPKLLAYKGEKQMAQRAQEYVIAHPELLLADA